MKYFQFNLFIFNKNFSHLCINYFIKIYNMSKEKSIKEKSVKKAPTKTLKEKRAAKLAKREEKKKA